MFLSLRDFLKTLHQQFESTAPTPTVGIEDVCGQRTQAIEQTQ